ncbi:MAG: DUF1549 domain-containing protein [Phycisphaera sp.]|nr:DUF1549 domain-containing protein [Phycisphaera sp.]
MWKRNLLFIAICLAGFGAVAASLLKVDAPPAARSLDWQINQREDFRSVVDKIDGEFAEYWTRSKLTPVERADDLTIARRLSLGLTGTIPSIEEIRVFEQVPAEQRVQWWVAHLLEDRRYSDYVAERLARAYVGVEGGPFLVYRRRRFVTWLSDQVQQNVSYDQLTRELIAGDGLWTNNPAVNFVTVTIDQNNKERGPDEVKLAARVSRAFLGVRIDCVQCHNDKLGDRWKQSDFHHLAAFFAGTDMTATGVRDKERDYEFKYLHHDTEEKVPPVVPFAQELLPEQGTARQRLAAWVTNKDNGAFARATVNRVWALMFGRPLVDPIDEIPLEPPYPPGMQTLADDFVAHGYDLRRLMRLIAATRVYQLDSRAPEGVEITKKHENCWAAFPMSRLRPEQVAGAVLQSASLKTIDAESHIIMKIARFAQENGFVQRYGDTGEDEFVDRGGTIPQRLLMMNGNMVKDRTKENLVMNAATRIAVLAPDDATAIETAYLAVLSRRPTDAEREHFVTRLKDTKGPSRNRALEDLYWVLINSTEFSWDH